jgi:HSP20 family protein
MDHNLKEEFFMFELRPYRRNQINVWNPFAEMEEFEKRFFGETGSDFKTDIKDEGDHYQLKADLPGFRKEDIHLDLDGDYLTISAERHSDHEEKNEQNKYIRWERSYGSYCRSFGVADVDQDKISAKYEDGVLTLNMPKQERLEPKPKRLMIE